MTGDPRSRPVSDLALLDDVRDFLRTHPLSNQSEIQRAMKKQKDRLEELSTG